MCAAPSGGSKKDRANKSVTDIRVVSDATGGLARHMLATVLTQFSDLDVELSCHAFCDTVEKLQGRLDGIKRHRSIVFSTLASGSLKATVDQVCEASDVPHFDLTGRLVEFIEHHTGLTASNDVEDVHRPDNAYFDRVDALEFSLQHDDSRRLETLDEADIVIVGISRVCKTPTSAYLGWLGHRVANVSIVPGLEIPTELRKCRRKCVGLTSRPRTLAEIRSRRLVENGIDAELDDELGYTGLREIIREVMEAEQIYRKLAIPVIDTSDLTIEEIAARILDALQSK